MDFKSLYAQVLLILGLFLASCASYTKINKIIEDPRAYDGKSVTIDGKVNNVFSLIVIKYFELDDGTGNIGVVTTKPLPVTGQKIQVTGEVRQAFTIGDRSLTVVLEKNLSLGK